MNQSNYSNDYDPDNPPDLGYTLPAKRYVKGQGTNYCEEPERSFDIDGYMEQFKKGKDE